MTETNIAYRTADHLRWQQLDFVVGIEIRLSGNHTSLGGDGRPHTLHDICDDLAGRYPKDFKFTGWHPQCRCQAVPILKTEEEMAKDAKRILAGEQPEKGSENAVTETPESFGKWVEANSDRIAKAEKRGTLPYFIRDNRDTVTRAMEGNPTENGISETQNKYQHAKNAPIPTENTVSEEDKKLFDEKIKNQLNSLLDEEGHYANSKLVRMMTGKEFSEKYRVLEVNEREAIVETSVGKITVNLRHGSNELYENLEIATDRMRRHGYEIELCEKFEDGKGADSYNRTLERFEEYKVNDKGTSGSIDRNIRDGAKQADVIVLRVDGEITLDNLSTGIHGRAIRCQSLKEIIIIMNNKEAVYTRKQFRKEGFKIQPGDFK